MESEATLQLFFAMDTGEKILGGAGYQTSSEGQNNFSDLIDWGLFNSASTIATDIDALLPFGCTGFEDQNWATPA